MILIPSDISGKKQGPFDLFGMLYAAGTERHIIQETNTYCLQDIPHAPATTSYTF
jgi:hypothetical protein